MIQRSTLLRKVAIQALFLFSLVQTNSLVAEPSSAKQHSHKNIIFTAEQFINDNIDKSNYSRVTIEMGGLDSRLTLTQCPMPLTSTLSPGSRFIGKSTVHIRCNSARPWTVYISAKISLYGDVVQTVEPFTKGHILREGDLVLVERELNRLRYGYFTDPKQIIGKQLKRRLAQNKVIKANYVKSPTLVKRGELVSIIAGNAGFSVKMTGVALASGAAGERIRVKNSSSKRIIEGIIKEAGVVSIN